MKELKSSNGKSASQFWLKDQISGKKKGAQEQVALIDPASGFMVYKPDDIKRVSLDYCVNLLETKDPKDGYQHIFKYNESIHNLRMKEYVDGDIDELPEEVFKETIRKLISKPGNMYDFLVKVGDGLQ